ncbi:MAG: RNA polymerase sigma factor [Patescibacteria group bacterium]
MNKLQKEFSDIYDQNINRIYRFIFVKVNSKEVAEDLCSETFLRTWQAFQKAGNPGHSQKIKNPSAFLYQIARNLVVDHYREKGRTQFISIENLPIVDPRMTIGEKVALNSDLEQVKIALANLNEDYQNVIIWHYLDDLPIPEIAQILDKQEGAVRVQLHRALKCLKEECNKININTS